MPTTTHGPSPAPTKTCSVIGGQCTKSQALRRLSCPSTTRRHSPESTRKSSCASSAWYMQFGSPGRRIPMFTPTCSKRASSLSNIVYRPSSLSNQRRSCALTTNQPSPTGYRPTAFRTRGASGTTMPRLIPMERSLPVAKRPRRPEWMKVRAPSATSQYFAVKNLMREGGLVTICEEARCPNIGECWGRGTATFQILGDTCTRACRYCYVHSGKPDGPPDPLEPLRLAQAAAQMKLSHVVVTSVDRDDLPDRGAAHYAATIRAIKRKLPAAKVEILTPDFLGVEEEALATILI